MAYPCGCLFISRPIQTVPYHLFHMYGRFADAELGGGRTDGGAVFYQVKRQDFGASFQILFDMTTPPTGYLQYHCMREFSQTLPFLPRQGLQAESIRPLRYGDARPGDHRRLHHGNVAAHTQGLAVTVEHTLPGGG